MNSRIVETGATQRSVDAGRLWRPYLPALAGIAALFLTGASLSVWTAHRLSAQAQADASARLEAQANLLEDAVLTKFDKPLQALKGLGATLTLDPGLSKKQFRDYWAVRGFQRDFPGVRGFGYIAHVAPGQIDAFLAATRRDQGRDFQIKTLGPATERYIIKLVEPVEDNLNAVGLDIGSEPVRRLAADESLRSGLPMLTGVINLVQDGRQGPSFLLLVPIYRNGSNPDSEASRRAHHLGFAYSPLVAEELLKPLLLQTQGQVHFNVEVRSPHQAAQSVFQSERHVAAGPVDANPAPARPPRFDTNRHFLFAGLEFRLHVYGSPAFDAEVDAAQSASTWRVGVGGIAFSAVLSLVFWLLLSGRTRAEARARELTREMRQLALVAEHTSNAVVIADAGLRIVWVNRAYTALSGYALADVLGGRASELGWGIRDTEALQQISKAVDEGRNLHIQTVTHTRDGRQRWVDLDLQVLRDEHGSYQGYVAMARDITEARQNESVLARERLRLASILEGTNVGTWEWNIKTGETIFNERWAGIIGYRLAELEPVSIDTWMRHAHPDDLTRSGRLLEEHFAGSTDYYECEVRMRHRDGHWVWVLDRGKVSQRDPEGRPLWMAGTHMDVTERHRLLEEIEHRNALMSAIMENLPGGLSVFDAELNLILRNSKFAELLHLPEALLTRNPSTFESIIRFNAERGEYGAGPVEQTVAAIVERARNPVAHVMERTRPDGSTLEIRGLPLPGGGFVTTYTDITQRKQTEKEARHSDEMLRQAINTLDEAFVIYDEQDRLLICNQRYRDTYPVAAEVMKPGNTFEYIIRYGAERGEYAGAVDRVDEWVAERLRQHRSGNTDVVQELGDGRFLRIVERRTAEGYTVGFRIDITDLIRARMAAEAASTSKSQFLANMSHEIRTPMNAILGMLSLLHNTELSARQLDYVNKTEGAAKSLLGLLNDILDFSKVEAGKMTLETAPFRMDHALRDLSVILSSSTGDKPLELLFDIDPRLPSTLLGDSLRLRQVLINLGGNAIKFTEQGVVTVRIAVRELQPGRARLEFSVSDTGIGIAPENLQRIFEGFSQAEASTTRRFGGTGLGLAISSRLVQLMGGQLQVESKSGQGSRFFFEIPLAVDGDGIPMVQAPVQRELQALRVLVIDDNPGTREVLQSMMLTMGWQVELASGGAEALARIHQRNQRGEPSYDAVFVDWQMPDMDGWETCQAIRRLPHRPCPPILLMATARGRETLAHRPASEQAMLSGYLVKPVTPSMLIEAVAETHHDGSGAPMAGADGTHKRRLQGMRVLVVEDNKVNQQVAQELLEREGAQVTLADNGALGVQAIAVAGCPWDAVLMDVQMPVMDGYTATRKVRQELQLRTLPIIAMTANAMESDRQDALAAGMNAHVGKPFDLDQLVATILAHSDWRPTPPLEGGSQPAKVSSASTTGGRLTQDTAHLDLAGAAERLGGDVGLLQRVLQSFAQDLPRQTQELADLMESGRATEARRLLHTLKGAAATVGARQLAAMAADGEHLLRAGHTQAGDEGRVLVAGIRDAVQAVADELIPLLQALQPQDRGAAPAEGSVDRTRLRGDLHALLELLNNSDMGSLLAHNELRDHHAGALGNALDALDDAMAGLDFELAASLCEALLHQYAA